MELAFPDPADSEKTAPPLPSLVPDNPTAEAVPENVDGFVIVGRVVNWNHTPSFTDVTVLANPLFEFRPGQFLGVWHRRRTPAMTVVQVGNSFEANPNAVPELAVAREALGLGHSYGQEGVSTRIFRLAECTTTEEFNLIPSGDTWQIDGPGRNPVLLARAGDFVVILPADFIVRAIGALPDPEPGVDIGQTAGVDPVKITIKPSAFQYHAGVFGNPGMGKSYLAGNLLEEAAAWGIPSLVLDINGEFIKAAKHLDGKVITLPDRNQFGLSLARMTPFELIAATPNVQLGTQYAELIELAHDQLRTEKRGSTVTFEMLRDRIIAIGDTTKTVKTSVGAAIARVSALEKDPLVGGDFDFVQELVSHGIVVLDCRYLSLRQTRLIAAMGARELQQIGQQRAREAELNPQSDAANWFALYFVDEAHAVMPEDDHVVSTQVFYELARMGRHVRTGLILSSQSPADLNSSVLKRLQLRFVFALERDQLRSIQAVIADVGDKIIGQLPKLPRGTCAVSGTNEVVRHGFLLEVRKRKTPVSGGTPPVFAKRTKKTGNASEPS